ncbi:hypothetical protein FEM03_22200 [Phragmitibacter flavus]|uniref:Transporter n=1 Tax=Phragmitibacter flavus TaxID=2576071 RepID=A0A5R8K892_9BACT|nr:hypothetical protein [Phragmitibacter flavus]TLD68520.1 hypothetical protein FEM03_22200 [Phragmitibacter flavus]
MKLTPSPLILSLAALLLGPAVSNANPDAMGAVDAMGADSTVPIQAGSTRASEMMIPPDIAGYGVGKPSLSFDYTLSDTMDFEDGSDGLDMQSFRARIPLFGTSSGDYRFSISSRYDFTRFETDAIGSRDLHEFNLSFQFAYIPDEMQPGWLGFIRLQPSLGMESGADISDALEGTIIGLIGYKFSPTFAAALGTYASYAYEDVSVYPAIGFIWRPSDSTYVQITPPLINLAWRFAPKWTVFVNTYPSGNKWQLDDDGSDSEARVLNLGMFRASAGVQYALSDNVRLSVRGGVNFLTDLEVRDEDQRVLSEDDLDSAPFGAATLTWVF